VKFEDFKEKQRETLTSIFSFLGLKPLRSVRSKDRNIVPYERAMNWEEKVSSTTSRGRHCKARAAVGLGLRKLEVVRFATVGQPLRLPTLAGDAPALQFLNLLKPWT